MTSSPRRIYGLLALLCTVSFTSGAAPAFASPIPTRLEPALAAAPAIVQDWMWPVAGPQTVAVVYRAPAHRYGAGHRGVDLAAGRGTIVSSPADGVVAFRGTVVDRPLLTIEHGDGLVSTLEPVTSELAPGDAIDAGQPVGVVAAGGHTPAGALHLGVRLRGEYINPLLLFGALPRAVLLPCCDGA